MHTDKSIYVSYLKKRDKAYLYDTLNVASHRFVDNHISDLKECQELYIQYLGAFKVNSSGI